MRNIPGAPRDSRLGPVLFGKGGGGGPDYPDPGETAQAQADANIAAARESAKLNQIGINSPWGKQFYTGTLGGPDRALNIELTGAGQEATESQQQLAALLSGFGLDTLGPQAMGRLGQEGSADVGNQIFERSRARMEPEYREAEDRLRSQMMSQGLPVGSRAYEQAMGQFGRREDQAMTDMALGADLQGLGENRAQRSQSLNELSALLQGSPAIQQPSTQMPAQYQVAPPDISGLTMGNYAMQNQGYDRAASDRAGLYGLAGQLGAAGLQYGLPALMGSDRRLKADIKPAGTWRGIEWYTYRYIWETTRRLGVMAQDLLSIRPDAVVEIGGYLAVDYGRLLGHGVGGNAVVAGVDGRRG